MTLTYFHKNLQKQWDFQIQGTLLMQTRGGGGGGGGGGAALLVRNETRQWHRSSNSTLYNLSCLLKHCEH